MTLLKIQASDLVWMKPSSLRSMVTSLWRRMVREEVIRRMVYSSSLPPSLAPSPLTPPETGRFHHDTVRYVRSIFLSCSEMHVD